MDQFSEFEEKLIAAKEAAEAKPRGFSRFLPRWGVPGEPLEIFDPPIPPALLKEAQPLIEFLEDFVRDAWKDASEIVVKVEIIDTEGQPVTSRQKTFKSREASPMGSDPEIIDMRQSPPGLETAALLHTIVEQAKAANKTAEIGNESMKMASIQVRQAADTLIGVVDKLPELVAKAADAKIEAALLKRENEDLQYLVAHPPDGGQMAKLAEQALPLVIPVLGNIAEQVARSTTNSRELDQAKAELERLKAELDALKSPPAPPPSSPGDTDGKN